MVGHRGIFLVLKIDLKSRSRSLPPALLQQLRLLQYLLRPCANPLFLSQHHPPHSPTLINQKLRRSRYINTTTTTIRMHQIPTPYHFPFLIRKKRKRVTRILHQLSRLLRTVNTDRDRSHPRLIKTRQIPLNTPQLGVTQRSPVTTIKNQQHTFRLLPINRRGQQLV